MRRCYEGCVYSIHNDIPTDFVKGCRLCKDGSNFTSKAQYRAQKEAEPPKEGAE